MKSFRVRNYTERTKNRLLIQQKKKEKTLDPRSIKKNNSKELFGRCTRDKRVRIVEMLIRSINSWTAVIVYTWAVFHEQKYLGR